MVEVDYHDVRVIDSMVSYYFFMRSKELSERQLMHERHVQKKIWEILDKMRHKEGVLTYQEVE